jgi:hypothetical protein
MGSRQYRRANFIFGMELYQAMAKAVGRARRYHANASFQPLEHSLDPSTCTITSLRVTPRNGFSDIHSASPSVFRSAGTTLLAARIDDRRGRELQLSPGQPPYHPRVATTHVKSWVWWPSRIVCPSFRDIPEDRRPGCDASFTSASPWPSRIGSPCASGTSSGPCARLRRLRLCAHRRRSRISAPAASGASSVPSTAL